MSGFIYNGKSTENILESSRLLLASFDGLNDITGVDRENIIGETTLTRPISNEYGTKNNRLLFEYSLVKENGDPFTETEQVLVEKWLTSPKLSKNLEIIDCDGQTGTIYCGKFISTKWKPVSNGWAGVIFSFENNSAYPKRNFTHNYEIRTSGKITLDCKSDELEEYIYPVLSVYEPFETANVSITNITDNSNTMTIRAYDSLPMVFNCKHCIPTDATTNGIISYKDLGWTDIGNIYWLRLLPGVNEIQVTGDANITISYDCPYKKVGGWL